MYENARNRVISPDGDTDLLIWAIGWCSSGRYPSILLVLIVLDYALRIPIDREEDNFGFHLKKRKSKRVGPVVFTDFDSADDIVLLYEKFEQAQIYRPY